MKKYTGFLLATAGGVAAASGAQAADLPMKGPAYAPAPAAASWAGPYIGAHAGVAWTTGKSANAEYGGGGGIDSTVFIGGGQIGYNWQRGNFVYGVEFDGSGLTSGNDAPGAKGVAVRANIEWLATFRGRFGLAVGDTMGYVTAGLAIGGVDNIKAPNGINASSTGAVKAESKTRVGWVVGGGIEHMWNRNWTVALEGLFVDLGQKEVDSRDPSISKRTTFSNQAMIARVKLNYKW
jgi:outer membrane immunogenic protein